MAEMIFRRGAYTPNPSPSPLAIRKHSHAISKANSKPKIRIIHIFAPEIIKTDVENFRELVQRLTGKPAERDSAKKKQRITDPRTIMREKYSAPIATRVNWDMEDQEKETRSCYVNWDMEDQEKEAWSCHGDLECRARMKMEEEMRRAESHGGGGGGGELFGRPYGEWGCYEEEFPLIAVDVSHMHAFEAAQLA